MIKEFAHLIENLTTMVVGEKIQVGHFVPESPIRSSAIIESAGGALFGDLPDAAEWAVQIISRAESYMKARDDAYEIFHALHGTAGWNFPVILSGVNYLANTIDALSLPAFTGQDEKGYFLFSTNYIVRLQEAECGPS